MKYGKHTIAYHNLSSGTTCFPPASFNFFKYLGYTHTTIGNAARNSTSIARKQSPTPVCGKS